MTDEVQPLADDDIAPPDGSGVSVDTGGDPGRQQSAIEEPAAPEPMSEAQQQGVAHLAELRGMIAAERDPGKRDEMLKNLAELSKHVFLNGPRPSWYGEQKPDPKAIDTRPADLNRDLNEQLERELSAPLSAEDREFIRQDALAQGAAPATASLVSQFAERAGLDRETARVIGRAFADAERSGRPFDHNKPAQMTEAEHEAAFMALARQVGSTEKAVELVTMARAWIESKDLGEWTDKWGQRLGYSLPVLQVLSFRARLAGLQPWSPKQ